jgi:hypothetical protein
MDRAALAKSAFGLSGGDVPNDDFAFSVAMNSRRPSELFARALNSLP